MKVAIILLAFLFAWPAWGATTGKVFRITDGDTITIIDDNQRKVTVRLAGIDCPERTQPYGEKALAFVEDLLTGQSVKIAEYGKDRYGRMIGMVYLEDGRNLNKLLLEAGLAWWYFQYSKNGELALLELDAKLQRVGLWQAKNPMPPWAFRRLK